MNVFFRLKKNTYSILMCLSFLGCSVDSGVEISPKVPLSSEVQLSKNVVLNDMPFATNTKDNKGSVATVNPIATQAALNAFAQGGNAIDAALAAAFTLGVVDSHNSGIGGGCFIVLRTADGEVYAIDGREMAPALASRDMYIRDGRVDASLSKTGALAVGIPGSVAALDLLQKKYGHLTFKDVLLPAANIAENGFPIDKILAARLNRTQDRIRQFPATSAVFLPNDEALTDGEMLVQKDLAKTYRKLAEQGISYFYDGEFAKQTARWMADNQGIITKKDFENYEVVTREPIHSQFNGYNVYGFPAPSSGGIHVSQILTMLDQYDLASLSEVDRYHLIIEALKLAFADRAHWLGDADFVDIPKGLLNKKYLLDRASQIDMAKTSVVTHGEPLNYDPDIFNKHTTHISTADAEGNWVAITTTINTSFGSKVIIPGTGVLLNNQMDDFSAQPGAANAFGLVGSEANSIEPGKRPLSSMSPTIVTTKNGEPVLTVGAAGGPTIISQVMETIVNHLKLNMPLSDAMSAVRVHNQWLPNRVYIDGFADEPLIDQLTERGHNMQMWPRFGATQAIGLKNVDGNVVFDPQTEPRIQ